MSVNQSYLVIVLSANMRERDYQSYFFFLLQLIFLFCYVSISLFIVI